MFTGEKYIDISLSRLFTIRYRLGMFDPAEKVKYRQIPENILEAPVHKDHALKMARQSIVLLKNSEGILPLLKSVKQVAVIGPNADNKTAQLGNYNGFPTKNVSVLEAIKEKLGPQTSVFYDEGVGFTTDTLFTRDNGKSFRKADMPALARRAASSDVIVFVGGISPELEGEEMSVNAKGFKGGDRTSILLPAVQTELLKHLQATGKPVILVLFTGSALAMPWESEHIPAIVNAWYGGQSTGTAVADVLFGDYNPAGRLPVTFYKSDADLPDVKDYSMKGRTYRYFKGEVAYPFGYGLSYSTFRYTDLKVPVQLKKGNPLIVEAIITNTGKLKGEEVVQLYVSHPNVKEMAPLRALEGFQRIVLEKGEAKKVRFELSADQLMLVDQNGKRYLPEGKLVVSIGGGQPGVKQLTSSNVLQHTVMIKK